MEGGPNIQEAITESGDNIDEIPPAPTTGCFSWFCHPNGTGHRFIALLFMCFLGFGSYFCYDNPAALQDYIKTDLNITVSEYTMLYSVYSWPNVILCFLGGFLIDRVFGIRLGTNIYMSLTLLGQIVFATGVIINNYWLMIFGRFIFGIGGESLAVAQNNYAVLWFKGKELNMVFGLQLSFSRVGSTVNFIVMEPLYNWVQKWDKNDVQVLGIVLFIAGGTCIFSMLCALILGFLDKRAERILQRNESASGEIVRLMDIKDFKASFWLITIICVAYYVAIFPFITLAKDFFMDKFNMTKQDANLISSIVYIISGVASPILGLIIDKTGKNVIWITAAVAVTIGSHILLGFTMINPYVGMVIMGIAYSTLASSLWPLVSLIIPEYQLGTAYGVCQAVQNLGLAVISIITGLIVEHWGYTALEIFFIGSLSAALLSTIILWILDNISKQSLNMTPAQRLRHAELVMAADILENEKYLSACAIGSSSEFLQPNSDFHIRNRYLSRIGAPLPASYDINDKGLQYRTLR